MTVKRLVIVIAAVVLVLALAIFGAFKYLELRGRFVITVTASFYTQDESGYTIRRQARPAEQAEVAAGNWAEDFRQDHFSDGVMKTSFGHGPGIIRGTIPAADIMKAWPDAPEAANWPFEISFYNLSSGRTFHFYLDIRIHTDTGTAAADLYVFRDGNAEADVSHWEGGLYEKISVSPEYFDI